MNLTKTLVCLFSFVLFVPQFSLESQLVGQDIHYQVSFPDAKAHYCEIQLTVDNPPEKLELMMPTWTPGSYLIREYARFVEQVTATNSDNEELYCGKVSKNRWQVNCGETDKVTFSYRLYGHELSVRTNWIDSELAILNGAATFIVPADRLEESIEVKLKLPKSWPSSVSALTESEDTPNTYTAENFHQLVDSPIVCGDCHVHPFQVSGVPHALVNIGDDDLWNAQQSTLDLKKLVAAHHQFWGTVPYEKYLFINVVRGGGGGLEHDNCTMIMSNRYTCRSDRSYKSWLTLASHEFFHTWNVRRLRPKTLTQYDYENEVYLRQLWIAEGITSYYENVLAARAGITGKKELLTALSNDIKSIESSPGNRVQSLSDSSFDTWIKFYRPHENSRNTTISYYSRGAVAALMLDLQIREASDNQKSLDDVMTKMYQEFVPSGYTSEDFRNTCSSVAGKDLSDWFVEYIDQPNPFQYDESLAWLGLQLEPTKSSSSSLGIGASLSDREGKTTIRSIEPNSPAYQAGLDAGDEVIGLNDRRIDAAAFSKEIKDLSEGDIVQLLIARRSKLMTLGVALESTENPTYKVQDIKEPSEDQTARQQQWLGEAPEETVENAEGEKSESAEASDKTDEEAANEQASEKDDDSDSQ